MGNPENAERPFYGPLRVRGGLSRRSAARPQKAQFYRNHRSALLHGVASRVARPEGREEDCLRIDEGHLSTRPSDEGGNRRTVGIRDGGPSTCEGTAEEDGLLRILSDVV